LNDEAVNELRQNGTTDKTLFTIGDKPYKVNDFNRFAKSHPMELDIQIDKFINKCILDYQSKKLASEHPEMSMRLKVYRDEKLVEEENKINSYEHIDSLALKDYFNQNRSKYEWDSPRFDGALIYSIDKKSGKKARKLLKKASRDQWNSLIAAEFNKTEERVRIQQGLFAIGDNPAIDGLVFDRTNNVVPLEGYKYITTVGKKKKVPDNYKDVIDKLSTDYRNYLQQEWAEHLRAVAKVEISEEVLKTVNNH
jgi:peptidyl-prolyl cis-trans isomerase SurA